VTTAKIRKAGTPMNLIPKSVSRRRLIATAGLLGGGALATAAAPVHITIEAGALPAKADDTMAMAAGAAAPAAATSDPSEMTADQMDAMHEAGIKSFPAPTQGKGGQPLAFEMDGDVRVFKVTCQTTTWEFAPGKTVEAMTYNGMVPGPEIRVTEGDKIRLEVTNQLSQSTAVHFHGVMVPNNMDGVPFITQPPIKPGETFTYAFQVREGNAGSHMYHSHHNSTEQVTKGLLGPFIVEPKDPSTRPAFDLEYTMVLNDGPIGGYSLNGKSFPATEPIVAKKGQKLLIRYMNEGMMIHPMHLHGLPQLVIARDGYLLPSPYYCDTLDISPGQRTEVIVDCTDVGVWAFHCHILAHAEGPTGMFGMVTALIIQES
jgi:FtsP/CotA-like multicopper oxidase with cupredoxin domain